MPARLPTSNPCILAFDTSSELSHVVLVHGDAMRLRMIKGGAASSTTLLPAIAEVLDEAQMPLAALDAIAFCAGPGAFTGVRTGAAVAQGLALANELPVLALNSLEMLALSAPGKDDAAIVAVIDARMNEVYFAAYRREGDRLDEVVAASVASADVARAEIARVVGSAAMVVGQPELLTADGWQPRATASVRIDGATLARCTNLAWQQGRLLAASDAQPIYVRNKVALTTAERAARDAVTGAH